LTIGLLPLFEAVVNSIHAIEEAGISTVDGRSAIATLRKTKQGSFDLNDSKRKWDYDGTGNFGTDRRVLVGF